MLAVILNQHLIKRRKQEEYKTAHSSPPDYETKNIVSSSDGVSCAEKDEPDETTEEKMKRISEAVKEHPENFEVANKIRIGKYYAFVKPFNVTFENGKREQIFEGCICRIKNDGNVVFEGSGVEMSEKTVEYIKKNAEKYLVDVTKLF